MMNQILEEAWLKTLKSPGGAGISDMYHTFWQQTDETVRQAYVEEFHTNPDLKKFIDDHYLAPKYDFEALASLPEDSFGYAFYHHLTAHNLQNVLGSWYQAYQKGVYEAGKLNNMPEEVMYASVRLFQIHDLWHILTGYDVSPRSELALQAFTVAQYRMPYSAFWMGVVTTNMVYQGPHSMLRSMDAIAEGWQYGKQAKSLIPVRWEEKFDQPLAELRREYNLNPPFAD